MVASTTDTRSDEHSTQSIAEMINKGWTLKAESKYDDAEASFRKALSIDDSSVEANYGLGLTLKAQDRRQDSIKYFEKVLELIETNIEDRTRAEMLKRLAHAHINQLRSGDWGLETEIWKHK